MTERVKAKDKFPFLYLGGIVKDAEEAECVFCGWATHKSGSEGLFVRSVNGVKIRPLGMTYKSVYADTLLEKFPDLIAYAWPEGAG